MEKERYLSPLVEVFSVAFQSGIIMTSVTSEIENVALPGYGKANGDGNEIVWP